MLLRPPTAAGAHKEQIVNAHPAPPPPLLFEITTTEATMAPAAAMRRKASNKRFDSNVTRSVSTASKVAAAERKPDSGIGLGTMAIIGFVILGK